MRPFMHPYYDRTPLKGYIGEFHFDDTHAGQPYDLYQVDSNSVQLYMRVPLSRSNCYGQSEVLPKSAIEGFKSYKFCGRKIRCYRFKTGAVEMLQESNL